ncbi:hypothetical protein FRB98_002607 [Tulasnella sp. 332]|nr:hypothetical protein FRB98_002607 [Tulasnella sp. 332]
MAEAIRQLPFLKDDPGYEGALNDRAAALPEVLQGLPISAFHDNTRRWAYRELLSGRWHLGLTKKTSEWSASAATEVLHGLRDLSVRGHCCPAQGTTRQTFPDNYGFTPLNPAGTPAIRFLPALYTEDDKLNTNNQLPKDHFSSLTFVDELIGFFDEAKEEKDDRQWFVSLKFTAPADPKVIAKYKGQYDGGPDGLRRSRLDALFKLGLIPKNAYENAYLTTS